MKNTLLIITLFITLTWSFKFSYSQNDTIIVYDTIYPGKLPSTLVEYNDFLYGTTEGGSYGLGLIYKMDKNGEDFTIIHEFDNVETGVKPISKLVIHNNYLYGICYIYYGCSANMILYRIDLSTYEYENISILDYNSLLRSFVFNNDKFYIGTNKKWVITNLNGEIINNHYEDFMPLVATEDYVYGLGDWRQTNYPGFNKLMKFNQYDFLYDTLYKFNYNLNSPSYSLSLENNYIYGMTHHATSRDRNIYKFDLNANSMEVIYTMENDRINGSILLFGDKIYCSDGSSIFTINKEGSDFNQIVRTCGEDTAYRQLTIIDSLLYYLVRHTNYYEEFRSFYVKNTLFDFSNVPNTNLKEKLLVYPNPAHNEININGLKETYNSEIIITDITGAEVLSSIVKSSQAKLHIKDLKTGIYLIWIKSEGKTIINKVVIH